MEFINLLDTLGLTGDSKVKNVIEKHNSVNGFNELIDNSDLVSEQDIHDKLLTYWFDNTLVKSIQESNNIIIDYSILSCSTTSKNYLTQYCADNVNLCKSKKMIINTTIDMIDAELLQLIEELKSTFELNITIEEISEDDPKDNNQTTIEEISEDDIAVPVKRIHGKDYFVNYLHNNKNLSETKSHIVVKHIFDIIIDILINKKEKIILDEYLFYTMKPKGKRKRHAFCDITADINVSQTIECNKQISEITKYTDSNVYIYYPNAEIYSVIDNILKINGIKADTASLNIEIPFLKTSKNDIDISEFNDIHIMPKELFTYKGSDNRNMVGLRFMSTLGSALIDKLQMHNVMKINNLDIVVTVGKAFDFGIKDRFVQPKRIALQHQKAIQITKIIKQEI